MLIDNNPGYSRAAFQTHIKKGMLKSIGREGVNLGLNWNISVHFEPHMYHGNVLPLLQLYSTVAQGAVPQHPVSKSNLKTINCQFPDAR